MATEWLDDYEKYVNIAMAFAVTRFQPNCTPMGDFGLSTNIIKTPYEAAEFQKLVESIPRCIEAVLQTLH